jgi:hypothetical protein
MNRSTVSRLNRANLCCGEAKQTSVGAERRDKLSLYNLHIERARACGRAASQAAAREAEGGREEAFGVGARKGVRHSRP